MLKTAEYVSLGHPDKTADFISCALLDEAIQQNPAVKFAVEVMIKDNTVVLGGEIGGLHDFSFLEETVRNALRTIGYNERYARLWGQNAIDVSKINIINLIGLQSAEIAQGVTNNGWGDQGIFVGYAVQNTHFMPAELVQARALNRALYEKAKTSDNLGIDIKTQITQDDTGAIETAVVAIPMREAVDLTDFVITTLQQTPKNLIINGTGNYTCHSSVADCGVTGRKLACDFYAGACPVGGGSPWTKDPSKADLTLNLYARKLAVDYLKDFDECFVYLSSCIGKSDLPSAVVKQIKNGKAVTFPVSVDLKPTEMIRLLGLNQPIYKELCQKGLMYCF